jgi:hypothetical protein
LPLWYLQTLLDVGVIINNIEFHKIKWQLLNHLPFVSLVVSMRNVQTIKIDCNLEFINFNIILYWL